MFRVNCNSHNFYISIKMFVFRIYVEVAHQYRLIRLFTKLNRDINDKKTFSGSRVFFLESLQVHFVPCHRSSIDVVLISPLPVLPPRPHHDLLETGRTQVRRCRDSDDTSESVKHYFNCVNECGSVRSLPQKNQ